MTGRPKTGLKGRVNLSRWYSDASCRHYTPAVIKYFPEARIVCNEQVWNGATSFSEYVKHFESQMCSQERNCCDGLFWIHFIAFYSQYLSKVFIL